MQEFEDPQAQLEDRQYNVQKKKDNHWYTKHYIVGPSPGQVKPKTIKLIFLASPLSMQH